jgi:hypothetical protein
MLDEVQLIRGEDVLGGAEDNQDDFTPKQMEVVEQFVENTESLAEETTAE